MVDDALDDVIDVVEGAGDTVEEGAGVADESDETDSPAARTETFVADIDGSGRSIERDVWVILLPAEHVERIQGWGFTVREQSSLATLDRVLLRVDAPEDRDIVQAALELALDAPGTLVDFNHVYRAVAESAAAGRTPASAAGSSRPSTLTPMAIGIIDTSVAVDHAAFGGADIVQKDFVPFAADRPLDHGTAVASILVGESRALRGRLAGARLYAASVFFHDDEGSPAATTASLVQALEWLASEGVRVVNMSLSGPPNVVLEAAIGATVERDTVVVAAVGNNGPVGEPLYPAAYESVVGVTAVDSANRVYRYANRGSQVTFSAPGVRVKVARSDGGYGNETGTSMAAPYAAAIIAQSMAADGAASPEGVLSTLKAAAIDLGTEDFDDVFGFGLIAAVD